MPAIFSFATTVNMRSEQVKDEIMEKFGEGSVERLAPRFIQINSQHPNISIYILHTIPYTFPLVLKRRIRLTIKGCWVGDHFLYSHDPTEWFSSIMVGRN